MEFLSPDNVAGQTLLNLVARGSAIVAELLRLSDHIPSVFVGSDPQEAAKYAPILIDLRYLKSPQLYDEKIDSVQDVVEMDEEFRDNHLPLLERFYKMFESIFKYARDFLTYLEELSEGVFVQLTIESVLMDVEGKQLMTEALYLYGVMLLLLEHRVPGPTRERMVVSYFRYRGAAAVQNVDDVAKLVRSTGFVPGGPRPPNYPEQMFERVKMPAAVVDLIIGRLRSDDIYNRSQAFPAPQHRSTALATQSAMLYVILYFAPELLTGKPAVMREIVDKHFQDNWVVPYYMGYTVDLSEAWAPYKAASTALNNVLERSNVEEVMARHRKAIEELAVENGKLLTKGVLVEEFVLDNLRKLLSHARQCNVTLRWWILHRTTVHKKFREAILRGADEASILMLLLNTAQFEFVLKEMFRELLEKKEARWNEAKREASGRMVELSEYFSGTKALTRVTKNEKLQKWFKQLGDDINALEFANTTLAGRKIQSISQALEEVQEFHQIAESLQVKSFLEDTRLFLTSMIRIVNVRSMLLADIDIISDLSYAFLLLDTYTPLVHNRIRADPSIVLLLRATFLKLSSLLSLPLVRITQAGSKDDVSVAEYYSSALVRYVRQVLDVVPLSVFAVLDQITKLQTQSLQPVPTKLERTLLKDHAQLRERYMLAQFTHQISVFTEGVLAMKTTLVGIIKLDPKQILEDGVRKQLVHQICSAMNEMLVFRTGKLEEFEQRLQQLGTMLSGIRSSFEYIQDYINVYGLRIWQQELSRIINYFVEQESNGFLKKKVYDWQSQFQSDAIPIPRFPALQEKRNNQHLSENFMGRLVREMLAQTDPRTTVYVDATQSWNASNGTREVAGIRTFDMLNRCVGVFGLTGIDKLVCFMIVRDLQSFVRTYRSRVDQNLRKFLHSITNALNPTTQFPPEPKKLYQSAVGKFQDLWPIFLEPVVRIGQMQLMRRQIANELNFSCKMDSKLLSCTLDVLNAALINDVTWHYTKPDTKPMPSNEALTTATAFLENAGVSDPITKIYVTSEPLEGVPCLMFLFVLSQVTQLTWSDRLSTLVKANSGSRDPLDGAPLVVGVVTVLKQFHSSYTAKFLAYLGQFVRASVSMHNVRGSASPFPPEVVNVLHFLEEFCRFSSLSRSAVEAHLPAYVFDRFTS